VCAIAGLFAYHYAANPIDAVELRCIRDHMARRGPDGLGEWLSPDGRVGFGHRRLAIIDLTESGAQPMASADGKLVITFNGEIYNYRALRADLERRGCVFRSQSDTEVLLHLYAHKGAAMVEDLRGMFAFALWDADKRGVLLARDPYGIKPLYCADDGWTLRFASQLKALVAGGHAGLDPDPAGWAGFLLFGSVPEPHTVYRDIRAVPAGTTLWVDGRGPRAPRSYLVISRLFASMEANNGRPQDAQVRIREALLDSVRHHLVGDVPVGIFLSAGVDSGALLGLMQDTGQRDICAVTLSYDEFRGRPQDEAPLAATMARQYGARHVMRTVSRNEFDADLPKIFDAMDQPTIDGINSWFAGKAAREQGLKAVLSGLGGDELCGGYPSFVDIPRWVRTVRSGALVPFIGDIVRRAISALNDFVPFTHPKVAGFLKYAHSYAGAYLLRRGVFMPWELPDLMDRQFIREGLRRLDPVRHIAAVLRPEPRTPYGKIAALEACLYLRNQLLRDTDWASMAHSLEVRLPLVDVTLLESAGAEFAALSQGDGKRYLARCPSRPLPAAVTARAKTGFTTPIEHWLKDDDRLRRWREVPRLRGANCPWARRWAYQMAPGFSTAPL
jgi:asparagine synthase (glutamine-hydrolysing)